MKESEQRYTKTLVVKLPEAAYRQIRARAFEKGTGMAALAREALFKKDGSLRKHD